MIISKSSSYSIEGMGLPPTGDVIQIVDEVPNIITQFGKCDGTKSIMQGTVSEYQYHTPSREERSFLYFNHLSKEFLEQMIPHLKALI